MRLTPALQRGRSWFSGCGLPPPRSRPEECSKFWEADDEVTRRKLAGAPEENLGLFPSCVSVAAVLDANSEADGCENGSAGQNQPRDGLIRRQKLTTCRR